MRALKYSMDEALASLWRGRRAAVFSLATITVTIFVLGGFLLVMFNMERLVRQWSLAAEFSVYLRDEATSDQRAAIEAAIRQSQLASTVEYLSKGDAARRFARDFPDLAGSVDLATHNPLPASVEVRVRPDAQNGERLRALADDIRPMAGVADVRYDRRWIERLMSAVRLVRGVGLMLATVLVAGAALTVASVVRLALYARRDEIHIMQLVGAPMTFIRGPFVLEGVFQGGLGALVAIVLLWVLYLASGARFQGALVMMSVVDRLLFLPPMLCALLVAGGMAVGCLGGLVAARSAR